MRRLVFTVVMMLSTVAAADKAGKPPTRLMDDINWMEFKQWVP